MSKVVTFGELLLRLSPPGHQRYSQAPHFEITFGGAEANSAVLIAQLGGEVDYVTRLPANEIADRAIGELRGLGVGVQNIARGGDRIGVYFYEHGSSQRPGKVVYDRANSAIAEAQPGDFDWEKILAGANWLHWTGITPALSKSAAAMTAEACAEARRAGLTVSFDLNFRGKLWTMEQAKVVLTPLMQHVDLCVTSAEESGTMFGIEVEKEATNRDEKIAARLAEKFDFKYVAFTQRQGALACETSWAAMLYADGRAHFSPRHEIRIVDRVGAGDSFSGALIFALMRGDSPQRAVDFAVAASALKHTIPGDYARVTLAEVESLAGGGGGGRVQR